MRPITLLSSSFAGPLAVSIQDALMAREVLCRHVPLEENVFPSGELWVRSPVTVRNSDVYLVEDLRWPDPNTALMRYALTVDMLKRASVERVHAVVPYIPFLRQERKDQSRVPISAKQAVRMIEASDFVRHTITFDMHADSVEGFFEWAVDHLRGDLLLARHYQVHVVPYSPGFLVVAPDVGASKRAQRFAKRCGDAELAVIDKRRTGPGKSEVLRFIGPDRIDGMTAVLYDDMGDSGVTLAKGAEVLYARGAEKVYAGLSHGLFTNGAEVRLRDAGVQVTVLDTIGRSEEYKAAYPWITFLPIAPLLADVIFENTHPDGSVSKFFV